MAYLRIKTVRGGRYLYILQSIRDGRRVYPKTLEYLGRNPDPARLRKALAYWKVKPRKGRRVR